MDGLMVWGCAEREGDGRKLKEGDEEVGRVRVGVSAR